MFRRAREDGLDCATTDALCFGAGLYMRRVFSDTSPSLLHGGYAFSPWPAPPLWSAVACYRFQAAVGRGNLSRDGACSVGLGLLPQYGKSKKEKGISGTWNWRWSRR